MFPSWQRSLSNKNQSIASPKKSMRIHKPGQTFSFSLDLKFNQQIQQEISAMKPISYTKRGGQTRPNFKFYIKLYLAGMSSILCFYFVFVFYNVLLLHLHSFQLSWLFYYIHAFIIDSVSSSIFWFSEMFSNFQIYNQKQSWTGFKIKIK